MTFWQTHESYRVTIAFILPHSPTAILSPSQFLLLRRAKRLTEPDAMDV